MSGPNFNSTDMKAVAATNRGVYKIGANQMTPVGSVEFGMSDTSKAVSFDAAFDDTSYAVNIDIGWQSSVWVTNKTTSGFTINVGSSHGQTGNMTVPWSIRPF